MLSLLPCSGLLYIDVSCSEPEELVSRYFCLLRFFPALFPLLLSLFFLINFIVSNNNDFDVSLDCTLCLICNKSERSYFTHIENI